MMPRNRVLIVFAHPAVQKSRVNRQMSLEVKSLPGVTFHDLYEEYPDFNIDIEREKKLLLEHQVIVFQHPFYWYSTPAIIKEWCDLALEYGFAYGANATQLKGKSWVHALTAGGAEEAYRAEGQNRYTLKQFLAPMEQTAYLCGMHFLSPFAVHGALRLRTQQDLLEVSEDYKEFIEFLRDYVGSWEELTRAPRFLSHQGPKTFKVGNDP